MKRARLLLLAACLGCSVLNGLDERPDDGTAGGDGGGPRDGSGDGAGSPDGAGCDAPSRTLELAPATVHLMVDRSGSMVDDFGGSGTTEWNAVLEVLASSASPLAALDHVVRFGMTSFTGTINGAMCPDLTHVPPALLNFDAIATSLQTTNPQYSTTGEAFQPVVELVLADAGAPRSILLVTDDPPRLCTDTMGDGTSAAVPVLQNAFAAGIPTRVIRVDVDTPDPTPFQRLANAGAGQPESATTPYDTALTTAELAGAVTRAVEALAPCRFPLVDDPAAPEQGELTLDGIVLVYGSDWTVEGSVVVLGAAACATFRAADAPVVRFRAPCR